MSTTTLPAAASNPHNPHTAAPTLLCTELAITSLMLLCVLLRFYSRLFLSRRFGADDAILGVAAATAVAHTAVTCVGTRHGIGVHVWDLDLDGDGDAAEVVRNGFRFVFASILLFHPVSALTKGERDRPIDLFWNQPFNIQRDCVDVLTLLVATAALNSVGDLLVYLWPIKFLFKLQMPLKHRLGLILLFSFGCIVFAASVCRIVALPPAMTSVDVLYNSSTLLLIASIEENMGIICGCLPCVKGALAHFWPRIFRSSSSPTDDDDDLDLAPYSSSSTTSPRHRHRHPRDRPHAFQHTGAGRVTGYGDHSHNHSATVVSTAGASSKSGRKASSSCATAAAGVEEEGEEWEVEVEMAAWWRHRRGDDERGLVEEWRGCSRRGHGHGAGDEESGGCAGAGAGGGIVLTQEVVVKRSRSVAAGGAGRAAGEGYAGAGAGAGRGGAAGGAVGEVSTVGGGEWEAGDGGSVGKGSSRRSV
ncbi:uncharacterized protein BKCO1_3300027 [Diplodia corticola]|uniref:Integral membrane protein n=1 Tax=Diplodia corticola TaxID=236234 RepID=A0A1J9QW00_9PEZI|nr:uncharacterized protein BKCO1_3300027 [Diplodia corticola]OJD33166.1 integral membrane protein [Diplodia corticola]